MNIRIFRAFVFRLLEYEYQCTVIESDFRGEPCRGYSVFILSMTDAAGNGKPGWMNFKVKQKAELSVEFFYQHMKDRFKLKLVAGESGLEKKKIKDKNLHRPGLALAGYVGLFTYHRLQVFGNTELYYMESLSKEDRIRAFSTLASFDIPCIVVPNGNKMPEELLDICNEHGI